MFHARLFLFATLGISAGCATQPVKDHGINTANAAVTDGQCHEVQITGSMISKTVCTTRADRDAQQRDADELRQTIGIETDARDRK
jgi:hypothetical protein